MGAFTSGQWTNHDSWQEKGMFGSNQKSPLMLFEKRPSHNVGVASALFNTRGVNKNVQRKWAF